MTRVTGLAAALLLGIAAGTLFAAEPEFSGILDSNVTLGAGTGILPDFFYGVEEYANLRLRVKLRDDISFYGAFNLIAAAGSSALALTARETPALAAATENYAAAIEPERLYFRLNGEYSDFEGGLLRIALGYGQVFRPSDFLNPGNPLFPDARPRAVLGGALSAYPLDSLKLRVFGSAPRNPLALGGEGGLAGFSGDRHWDRASVQILYAYESPGTDSRQGIHRGGLSLKADVELGFTADLLYTYRPGEPPGTGGLSLSGGLDYSFGDGKWYVLAEYLYNGSASSTSARGGRGEFFGEHFLYTAATWLINDYTSLGLACLSGFGDLSFVPILSAEHELFQGFTLSLSARLPLDRDVFSGDGNHGELGPLPPDSPAGSRFILTAKARLRL
jgi:hypothetical protein